MPRVCGLEDPLALGDLPPRFSWLAEGVAQRAYRITVAADEADLQALDGVAEVADVVAERTNLTVVAPGIAEALLATGIGLIAAIPAVVFYNKLNSDSEHILGNYEAFADEFATILSRQLDA